MKTQKLEYTNGTKKFIGHLVWDETKSGKRPGVVVFPEAFGLNDHARIRAERLAQLGYVALAADPHGDGALINDMAVLGPAMQALFTDRAEWRSRARTALDALIAQPQVDAGKTAAIGNSVTTARRRIALPIRMPTNAIRLGLVITSRPKIAPGQRCVTCSTKRSSNSNEQASGRLRIHRAAVGFAVRQRTTG